MTTRRNGSTSPHKQRWVVRVWLPDRPGSLAAVAAALSASGCDVVGIDVVERSAGTAVDDLTIDLTDAPIDDVVTSVSCVDGVAVEDVRRDEGWRSTTAEALIAAAALLSHRTDATIQTLCEIVLAHMRADWTAVTGQDGALLAASGALPDPLWLQGLASGLIFGGEAGAVENGLVFQLLADGALIVARSLPAFLGREIDEIEAWAAVADLVTPGRASLG